METACSSRSRLKTTHEQQSAWTRGTASAMTTRTTHAIVATTASRSRRGPAVPALLTTGRLLGGHGKRGFPAVAARVPPGHSAIDKEVRHAPGRLDISGPSSLGSNVIRLTSTSSASRSRPSTARSATSTRRRTTPARATSWSTPARGSSARRSCCPPASSARWTWPRRRSSSTGRRTRSRTPRVRRGPALRRHLPRPARHVLRPGRRAHRDDSF